MAPRSGTGVAPADDRGLPLAPQLSPAAVLQDLRLDQIDVAAVDRYKPLKVREGVINASQINKSLNRLTMILDVAVDYGYISSNPATSKGGRRRVKAPPPAPIWVEPEQLLTLLDSAPKGHRVILAVLAGAGLRVGEACGLDWRDLDLSTGTLTVRASKTNTGLREVDLPQSVLNELWTLAATSTKTEPNDPVFVGTQKRRQTRGNVARRLKSAISTANPKLERRGIAPLSERVSPHSLRRTYASLRYACGDDPIYVAEQGGWSDPSFPMKVYAKAVRRRDELSGVHLEQFDAALEWAAMGSKVEVGYALQAFGDAATRPAEPILTPHTTENAPPGRRGASGVTTGRRDIYLYICGSVGGR